MKWVRQAGERYARLLSPEDRKRAAAGLLPMAWTPEGGQANRIPATVAALLREHGLSAPVVVNGKSTRSWTIPGPQFDAEHVYRQREREERERKRYGSWYKPRKSLRKR